MSAFLTGNQTIVLGALRAGCEFFAGYPITPASSILSEMMLRAAPGCEVVQTEDEIAAIGQCIGASMAGARAMTATSGPGMSLYSENVGLAQMIEAPLVIVDCQRMGPATGGATTGAEGDVMFARHMTPGGYPLPVLAATDAASAYRLTVRAFDLAERLRTPVVLLVCKDIAMTRQVVDLAAEEVPPRRRRLDHCGTTGYRPFAVDEPRGVPEFVPIGGAVRVRVTGSIHDDRGLLTTDRAAIGAKLEHLCDKITAHGDLIDDILADIDPQATVLVISYGLTAAAAREAVADARSRGRRVSHLTLFSLWPVPDRALAAALTARVERIIVPELNVGLYAEVIRGALCRPVESLARYDGSLIDPAEIGRLIERAAPAGQEVAP